MMARKPRIFNGLLRDRHAVAMMEFALAAPVVLAFALGGLETANLALAHLRISQIAMTTADNAGRVNTRIDESDINEVFAGAAQIGKALDFMPHGRIVLSSLQDNGLVDPDHGQMINWQRCSGSLNVAPSYGLQNAGRTNATLAEGMGPTGRKIQSLPGTAVMMVEVTYDYQPLISSQILGATRIRYESAFNVRERVEQNITNVKALPLNSC